MTIGVTGGSGAIGSYVCDELIKSGYRVICIDRQPPKENVEYRQVDLNVLESTKTAFEGCNQVVHLAAIPDPFGDDSLETVIGNNTVSSYTVFEAARLGGIKRVVYGCSESSTGFGIHHVKLQPEYIPIDEEHPVWPHEAYSLSKHFGERIGAFYAKAFSIEVISLRYMWVWLKRSEDAARKLAEAARRGERPEKIEGFGAYIAVRDVARACRQSVRYEFPANQAEPFEVFFLAARDSMFPVATLDVVRDSLGKVPEIRDPEYFETNPTASVFDIRKADKLLDWRPKYGWHTLDSMEF